MAADVELVIREDTRDGDIELTNGDLVRDEGLVTAVNISLFTDRRADDSDEYDNDDKKGWWADEFADIEDDTIGSKLWLLNRAKSDRINSLKAKEYIFEALEWMIEDRVVAKIEIDTFTFGENYNKRLGAVIKLYQSDGNVVELKYDDLWKNTPVVR